MMKQIALALILLTTLAIAAAQDRATNQQEVRDWLTTELNATNVEITTGPAGTDYIVYVPHDTAHAAWQSLATAALRLDTTPGATSVLIINDDRTRLLEAVRRINGGLTSTGSWAIASRTTLPHGLTEIHGAAEAIRLANLPRPITFTSDPVGAMLSINGTTHGPTPITIELPPNRAITYRLEMPEPYSEYNLYHPHEASFTPTPESTTVSAWIERTTAEEQTIQRQKFDAAQQPPPPKPAYVAATQSVGHVFANDLDATAGCGIQATIASQGGYCWTLNNGTDLHQSRMDLLFRTYSDITTLGPWERQGTSTFRLFTFGGDIYAVFLFEIDRFESVGAILHSSAVGQ